MIRLEPKEKSKGLKRTPLKHMSKKMQKQRRQEKELSQKLLEKNGGFCMRCKKLPDWRGLSKHEIIFRSQGGDPLDEPNTILICGKCHAELHGIHEIMT